MNRPIRVHIVGALSKGNVGSVAAQKGLYKIIMDSGQFDLSVSVGNREIFKLYQKEFKDEQIYPPLRSSLGTQTVKSTLQWILVTLFNLPLFTFSAMLIQMGLNLPFKTTIINRMRKCDIFIDLNLEFLKGIPISTSPALIRQKPRTLLISKIFWSYRIFYGLWYFFIVKSTFKKNLIVGPASFGPFSDLPAITRYIVRFILTRFVDVILVREPYSEKILRDIKVTNFILTTDAALTVKSDDSIKGSDTTLSKPLIGFAPAMLNNTLSREEINNYVIAHAQCIDELIQEHDSNIVFLPSSPDDIAMCKAIIAKINHVKNIKLIITDSVDEYEAWVKKLSVLITSRMHPSIIAARNFVPFYAIIYDHKQLGVLEQLGLQKYSTPIGKINYLALKQIINITVNDRAAIEKHLRFSLSKTQDESISRIKTTLLSVASLSK